MKVELKQAAVPEVPGNSKVVCWRPRGKHEYNVAVLPEDASIPKWMATEFEAAGDQGVTYYVRSHATPAVPAKHRLWSLEVTDDELRVLHALLGANSVWNCEVLVGRTLDDDFGRRMFRPVDEAVERHNVPRPAGRVDIPEAGYA